MGHCGWSDGRARLSASEPLDHPEALPSAASTTCRFHEISRPTVIHQTELRDQQARCRPKGDVLHRELSSLRWAVGGRRVAGRSVPQHPGPGSGGGVAVGSPHHAIDQAAKDASPPRPCRPRPTRSPACFLLSPPRRWSSAPPDPCVMPDPGEVLEGREPVCRGAATARVDDISSQSSPLAFNSVARRRPCVVDVVALSPAPR